MNTPLEGELTPPAKATNRRISATRIWIGHAIEGCDSGRQHRNVLWLVSLSPTVPTMVLCLIINIENSY